MDDFSESGWYIQLSFRCLPSRFSSKAGLSDTGISIHEIAEYPRLVFKGRIQKVQDEKASFTLNGVDVTLRKL
jgi:hypothetical protein